MTSSEIMALLEKKFCPPYFVFLPQLRDATGFDASNTADALALGLYRSRGRDLHGFEIKVSRSDWLRELKKPEKAERIAQYCDLWTIVASEPEIVKLEELPTTWGLMVAFNGKLTVVKRPIKIDAAPISRELLCSIVKKTFDLKHKPAEKELEALRQEEFKRGKEECQRRHSSSSHETALKELRQKLEEFQKASGITIHDQFYYEEPQKIGEAVRVVLGLLKGETRFLDDRGYFLTQAIQMVNDHKDGIEHLRRLFPQEATRAN